MLLGSRALPAAAISRLLSDRGESVPTFVMTGLPMSLLGLRYYSVFKASKPRPLGGAVPVTRPLGAKQNPLTRVGHRYLPNLLGGYPVAASVFNSLPVISQRSIPPTPRVSNPFSEVFGVLRLPLNRPMPLASRRGLPRMWKFFFPPSQVSPGPHQGVGSEDYSVALRAVKRSVKEKSVEPQRGATRRA